jgi:hypothetical protein
VNEASARIAATTEALAEVQKWSPQRAQMFAAWVSGWDPKLIRLFLEAIGEKRGGTTENAPGPIA